MSAHGSQKQLINKKKAQLLNELKQKQSQYKLQIQQYEQQSRQIHGKIIRQCEELKLTTGKLKEKAEEFIGNCKKSLDVEFVGKEMINIKELANYLKSQKEMLLKLSSKQNTTKPKDFDLHSILSKSKFQQTLLKLKKIQLQEEIKYLQTNVLVKNNIIYNAASSSLIVASQQKEINNRLESLVNQLQRVITLSIGCVSHEDQSGKVDELERQTFRLKECESLLVSQSQKLGKITKYFQSQCLSITSNFVTTGKRKTVLNDENQKSVWQHRRVLQSELDLVNDLQLPQSMLIGKFLHQFDTCEEQIDLIRKKYKQYEHLRH